MFPQIIIAEIKHVSLRIFKAFIDKLICEKINVILIKQRIQIFELLNYAPVIYWQNQTTLNHSKLIKKKLFHLQVKACSKSKTP